MLVVGLRVVRGPDWAWENQDQGEGHVGTVVEVGKPGTKVSQTVFIQWDNGDKTNYRAGFKGAYDLRVLDNAPAGVKHLNIVCDGCKTQGIAGLRFKCTRCYDYDLCGPCYHSDKHDLNHVFQRFETANAIGVEMIPRKGSKKTQSKGIFIGAKVVRSTDWEWGDQDGGPGHTGRVVDIKGWDNETSRSVAKITWSSGNNNVYRIGHNGRVDLKYIEEAVGGDYYPDHLPILGHLVELDRTTPALSGDTPSRHLTFKIGDRVKVLMPIENLKLMQKDHGGWNDKMTEYIGQVGVVHRVTDRGDIRVTYDGCNNRWTFNPAVLTKIEAFSVGDQVRVISDPVKVKDYQKGHGEWIEVMKSALGKLGTVIKIYSDGDLRVSVADHTWTLNPLCVEPATLLQPESPATTDSQHIRDQDSVLANLMETQLEISNADKLVREAAQGHIDPIRDFITNHPDQVDIKSHGKTCLLVACHQGHMALVCLLLSHGASLCLADDEGDSALHYAAFGNQPTIMEVLLERGADVNAVNKSCCSPLHVAANKQFVHCVRVLLKHKANVNVQDSYGDTALHDAIGKESADIVEMLCCAHGVDFTVRNKRGFNILHHAALKGNNLATERIVQKVRHLVDVKKDDGFAALHLACLNGHRAVVETLALQGRADTGLPNNKHQSPLLLAASQGHCAVVELLVGQLHVNLDVADEEGDTALHIVLHKRASINTEINENEAPSIYGIWTELCSQLDCPVAVAVACYLVQEGCTFDKSNANNQTPLDLVGPFIQNIIKQYIPSNISGSGSSVSSVVEEGSEAAERPHTTPVECGVCSELADCNVLLEPCRHRVACEECSALMKKCIQCGEHIYKRLTQDGRIIACKSRQPSAERLRYLESKIAEIEEAHCCSICMERRRNVAFLCGHGACDKCSLTLRTCHMCRKTITKKINLY